MANSLFNYARELAATTGLAWTTGVFKAYLIDTGGGYTFAATDQFFSAVAAGAREAGPVTLQNATATGGACDADDITFSAVAAGPSIEAILIIKFVTNDADSPNVAWIDTATGLAITPNGGDIIVTWDSQTNKIFRV